MRLTDDRKRELLIPVAPRRIVSLVPSDTYNVAALGRGEALVGRTDYCELPTDIVAKVPSVGGTKNPRVDDIIALNPDLVLANQEENTRSDLEKLAQVGIRIYIAFPKTFAEGVAHLAKLARIFRVEREPHVKELVGKGYEATNEALSAAPARTFCPIWMKPLMTIHGDTFISDMIARAGGVNVFRSRERKYPLKADLGEAQAWTGERVTGRDVRYPRVTEEEVVAASPDVVILPDEPHPFSEGDAAYFRALDVPAARVGNVIRIGGKDLSWYGAGAIEGLPRLRAIFEAARRRLPSN